MRHMCLYISDPDFSCVCTDGITKYLTEVFHEALADLKTDSIGKIALESDNVDTKYSKVCTEQSLSKSLAATIFLISILPTHSWHQKEYLINAMIIGCCNAKCTADDSSYSPRQAAGPALKD